MDLGFIKSPNEIIYWELDEIQPDQDKVSGGTELENKINEPDMEIRADDGKDSEVDADSETAVCSDYREKEDHDIK